MIRSSNAPWYLRIDYNTTAIRLAYLRNKAVAKGTTWREQRSYRLDNWEGAYGMMSQGKQDEETIYCTHNKTPYFRNERECQKVYTGINHNGWYTQVDGWGGDLAVGIVGGLSHGRLIAGYRWSSNDESVWLPEIFSGDDAEKEAALAADRHAERFAEQAREDDEKFQAASALNSKIEDGLTDLMATRPELWLALAARQCEKTSEKTRLTAQKQIANIRETAHELVEQIRQYRTERAEMGEF